MEGNKKSSLVAKSGDNSDVNNIFIQEIRNLREQNNALAKKLAETQLSRSGILTERNSLSDENLGLLTAIRHNQDEHKIKLKEVNSILYNTSLVVTNLLDKLSHNGLQNVDTVHPESSISFNKSLKLQKNTPTLIVNELAIGSTKTYVRQDSISRVNKTSHSDEQEASTSRSSNTTPNDSFDEGDEDDYNKRILSTVHELSENLSISINPPQSKSLLSKSRKQVNKDGPLNLLQSPSRSNSDLDVENTSKTNFITQRRRAISKPLDTSELSLSGSGKLAESLRSKYPGTDESIGSLSAISNNTCTANSSSIASTTADNTTYYEEEYVSQPGPSTSRIPSAFVRSSRCVRYSTYIPDGVPSMALLTSTPYDTANTTKESYTPDNTVILSNSPITSKVTIRRGKKSDETPKKMIMRKCSVVLKRMAMPSKRKSKSPRKSARGCIPEPESQEPDINVAAVTENTEVVAATKRGRKKKSVPINIEGSPIKSTRPRRLAQPTDLTEKRINRKMRRT